MDNNGTYKSPSVQVGFAGHPRIHVRFTPTLASGLNQVEHWFALISQRQVKRGALRSTIQHERGIREYVNTYNEDPRPFICTKTADAILASLV